MGPDYIEEITLNSGHRRRIMFSSVRREDALRMREIARRSDCKSGVLIDDYHFHTILADGAYFCTISEWLDGKLTPMLITCGARKQEAGQVIWSLLQRANGKAFPILNSKKAGGSEMPELPFIATAVLPNRSGKIGKLFTGGSGPLCAALGCGVLFPEVFGEAQDSQG